MRLKTLATGITLAFVGLAGSAAHAQSGSLGVETDTSTAAALGTEAGDTGIGVGSNVEIGVEAEGRSQSALDAASSTLESVRQTGEHATQATDEAIGNLGTAAKAQGSVSASGELL